MCFTLLLFYFPAGTKMFPILTTDQSKDEMLPNRDKLLTPYFLRVTECKFSCSWAKLNELVLLNSFHLNGHTSGFHKQTQKLKLPSTYTTKQHDGKVLFSSFHLNGHTHGQTRKLEPPQLYSIINNTTALFS